MVDIDLLSNTKADWCHVLCGTNDNGADGTSAGIITSLDIYWKKLEALGFKLILGTLLPRATNNPFSGDQNYGVMGKLSIVNDYIRSQTGINGRKVADYAVAMVDNDTGLPITTPIMFTDNLHPNQYGAWVMGAFVLAPILKEIAQTLIPVRHGKNLFTSQCLTPNPKLLGTGGTVSAPVSGTTANGFKIAVASGTFTSIASANQNISTAGDRYSTITIDAVHGTDNSNAQFGFELTRRATKGASSGTVISQGVWVNANGVSYKQIASLTGTTGSATIDTFSTTIGDVITDGTCKWLVMPLVADGVIVQLTAKFKIATLSGGSIAPYLVFYQDSINNNASGRPYINRNQQWIQSRSNNNPLIAVQNLSTANPDFWTEPSTDFITIVSPKIKLQSGVAPNNDVGIIRCYLQWKGKSGTTVQVIVKDFDLKIVG
ncbi:hypothetical protein [Methylobacter sp. S3L5C]|uniref:SGNH/GDSL hydrolase family protein n=1 Tax=Methylobacter sp. S3L5C TaxID=2839024 RepID=UPI001FAB89E8|nr:hypothetical protein [Methylobacter sp. S3L5C]UOA08608.1 hypothetical protein KKZ03_20860 [Methylobacter sp. S3L5C]